MNTRTLGPLCIVGSLIAIVLLLAGCGAHTPVLRSEAPEATLAPCLSIQA